MQRRCLCDSVFIAYLITLIYCSALQICLIFRRPFAPPISFSLGRNANLVSSGPARPGPAVPFPARGKEPKTRQRARHFDSPLPLETLTPPTKKGAAAPSLGFSPGEYGEHCSVSSGAFFKICFSLQWGTKQPPFLFSRAEKRRAPQGTEEKVALASDLH